MTNGRRMLPAASAQRPADGGRVRPRLGVGRGGGGQRHGAGGAEGAGGDRGEERIGQAGDQGRDEADAPEPGRVAAAERAEQVGPEAPAAAAAELGQNGAKDGIRGGNAQTAKNVGYGAAQADQFHHQPVAAAVGADNIGRAAVIL